MAVAALGSPLPPPSFSASGHGDGGGLTPNSLRGRAGVPPSPTFSAPPSASSPTHPLLPLFSRRLESGHGRLPTAVSQTEGFFDKGGLLCTLIAVFLVRMSICSPEIIKAWPVFFKACYVLLLLSGLNLMGALIFMCTASAGGASYSTQAFTTVAKALLIISSLALELPILMIIGNALLTTLAMVVTIVILAIFLKWGSP